MKALVGIRIIFWVKNLNDECSGYSLLERNLSQYGVHAKIIVFCKTYNTVHGVHGVHMCPFGEKNSDNGKKKTH